MDRKHHWIIAVLILGLAGCAGTKPCMIIPAQIELAEDVRDAAHAAMEKEQDQVKRWQNAIDQSRTRLERLIEDRDRLKEEVGETGEEEKK
jgi:hypothetical protein